jgi:hypothetical protein
MSEQEAVGQKYEIYICPRCKRIIRVRTGDRPPVQCGFVPFNNIFDQPDCMGQVRPILPHERVREALKWYPRNREE